MGYPSARRQFWVATIECRKADFKITYDVRRWLLIQPYATYQRRTSNYPLDQFTSTIIGIKFQAKMQPPLAR